MLHRDPNDGLLVRCAIRFDVTITTAQAANFPATCNLRHVDNHAAVLLAVCDERYNRHAVAVLDALRGALDTAGIPVLRRLMTPHVTHQGHTSHPDPPQCAPPHPQAAAHLGTHTGARLPAQPRAEALTPAPVSYRLLGDAIRAGIATDAAPDEAEATHCPTPRLVVLLLAALRPGIPPPQIRRIL